ncbi:MAG: class I SAM-dependent methyltransferase [Deltaproteobacteria bacterium]|nr:class I SAM-dependent methyltransferase [Deltaproteobacteria bacterium]
MTDFDEVYARGAPPWDTGRPQEQVVSLFDEGEFNGRLLDVGCGTGENALYLSQKGYDVTGVDGSAVALERARAKAERRGLPVSFVQGDALRLPELSLGIFDTVLDCGLFHVFTNAERLRYLRALETVLLPGGRVHVLCFSDIERDWGGPRRVSSAELRALFRVGWTLVRLERAMFQTNLSREGSHAWIVSAEYEGRAAPGVN